MAASTNEEALAGIKLLTPFPVADSNDNDNKYSTDLALLPDSACNWQVVSVFPGNNNYQDL